jgi:primosomal protein N' (replication factor Y) (superfamily II helicase)
VLAQSRVPHDDVLRAAAEGDPAALMASERERRSVLGFPPFGGLAELSGDAAAVEAACDALRDRVELLGPSRGRALLRSPTTGVLADALRSVDLTSARGLGRLRVDVDPLRV